LNGYPGGKRVTYKTVAEATEACKQESTCLGISQDLRGIWTLKASDVPVASKGETSMLKSCFAPKVRPSWILTVCEATEGYTAQFKDELTFRKGEKIDIIIRNENGWSLITLVKRQTQI